MEWHTEDKSTWGEGPWMKEPDKVQFIDEATGLDCLVVRGPAGALCGYVGVAKGHPFFSVEYDRIEQDVRVHGGLTFSGFCHEGQPEGHGICHVAEEGRPEKVWWLGFDCAHYMDGMPKFAATSRAAGLELTSFSGGEYRDMAYVKAQIARLAKQIAEVK